MYVAVACKADGLGRHLRVGRVRALPDLRLAALHRHRAVKVQKHAVGGGLQRDGIDRRIIPERCNADAAADGAGIPCKFLHLAVVIDVGLALFKAVAEGIVVICIAREAVVEALGHDVLHAVFERLDANGLRALVDVRIVRE